MKIRKFNLEKDYPEVVGWWKKQGWPVVTKNMLSKYGFMVEHKGKNIAASWGYATGSNIFIMEWTIGNPEVDYRERKDAIYMLIETISNWAKVNGAEAILTMTKNNRFIEKLEDCDFIKTDTGMTHLLRRL
jgi:hypothetical protein